MQNTDKPLPISNPGKITKHHISEICRRYGITGKILRGMAIETIYGDLSLTWLTKKVHLKKKGCSV